MRLAVDLASRFSAACLMDTGGKVFYEFDSWGKTKQQFAFQIAAVALDYQPEILVIEDVPYGIRDQSQVKPALKLQGRIEQELENIDDENNTEMFNRMVYVVPVIWQKTYHLFKKTPAAAKTLAGELGYDPPKMREIHASEIPPKGAGDPEKAKLRTKAMSTLKKSEEDYVSAFLMARWAYTFKDIDTMLAEPGVQRPTP